MIKRCSCEPNGGTELSCDWMLLLRLPAGLPDRMKKMPETKARMVRCGRMCPMLLMTKAVKTKSKETIGKGVAVRTISAGATVRLFDINSSSRRNFPENSASA